MNYLVKLYIAYRKNGIINSIFGMLLLISALLIFYYTVHLETLGFVIEKSDIPLFSIGILNLLFGYRRILLVMDKLREDRLSKKIDCYITDTSQTL